MQEAVRPDKKTNRLTRFSLLLNLVFILILCFAGYKFRYKIYNKIFPDKTATIIMFGNSLTEGGEWEKLLSRQDVANEGRGGFTTSHFVFLMQEFVVERKPKICFIEGGINDLGVGIPMPRTLANIEKIIDTLKGHNIIPILTLTTYTNKDTLENIRIDSLNRLVKEVARQRNVEYFDLNDKLSKNGFLKPEYTTDGIHLTRYAYPFWADKVKEILAEHKL